MIWFFIIPIATLLLGLADMPSGYYSFLRIVVCISSCLYAYWSYCFSEKVNIGVIIFVLIAILFNPIIPVYLYDSGTWGVIDVITAIIFGFFYFFIKDEV